jgi:hypothetical protein
MPLPSSSLIACTHCRPLVPSQVPQRIVIIGGGYIAVEFAGIFAGLGSEVHLVYRQDLPLRGFDEEVRAVSRCMCVRGWVDWGGGGVGGVWGGGRARMERGGGGVCRDTLRG